MAVEHWRGQHHGRPDPEFALLCAEAELLGLVVELSANRFGRRLCAIELCRPPGQTVLTIGIGAGETLRAAAVKARGALEAL